MFVERNLLSVPWVHVCVVDRLPFCKGVQSETLFLRKSVLTCLPRMVVYKNTSSITERVDPFV